MNPEQHHVGPVAESQAPATSEPGDAGVAPGRADVVPDDESSPLCWYCGARVSYGHTLCGRTICIRCYWAMRREYAEEETDRRPTV